MVDQPYYGPAGIFSTDDPVSDAMQIAAEEGPWDEDDWWQEDEPEVDYLYGSCACSWRGSGMFYCGDAADHAAAVQELRGKHRAESLDCQNSPTIG